MEERLDFHDGAGRRLAGILTGPAAATDTVVVLCHGFLSNKNSSTNKSLARLLADRGIATYRFDFFGQGESDGPFQRLTVSMAVEHANAALALMANRRYRRLALVGSSFGGLVSILVASRRSDLFALALKCPVPDFPELLRFEFHDDGIERWKESGTIPDVTGGPKPVPMDFAFYEDCLAHDAYKAAAAITAPTLIVQGDCDEYTPVVAQARRLMDGLRCTKQLEMLPGADHTFSKGEDFHRMTNLIVNWLATHQRGC